MLLRISFFQQHKRKRQYIFAAPSDAITVVHRVLQKSPKARDDLLVKGDDRVQTDTPLRYVIGAFGVAACFFLLFRKIFVQGQSGHRDPIRHSQTRGDPLVPTESRS